MQILFASYISTTWEVSYYNITIVFGTIEGVAPSTVYCLLDCHLKQRPLERSKTSAGPRALDQVMTLQSASRLPRPSKGSQRRPRWTKKTTDRAGYGWPFRKFVRLLFGVWADFKRYPPSGWRFRPRLWWKMWLSCTVTTQLFENKNVKILMHPLYPFMWYSIFTC